MNESIAEKAREAARQAALTAWESIAGLYRSGSHVEQKADGPTTEADKVADRIISAELKKSFPPEEYGYLTEETEDDPARLERDLVWIIDPIDGTRDFIKQNGNFTIHVGLVERGADGLWHGLAAVVYRPIPGELYSAIRGRGSRVERCENNVPQGEPRRLAVSKRATIGEMKAVISSSHRNERLDRIIKGFGFAEVLSVGSMGIKLSLIAKGDYDFYIQSDRGKSREWDNCAPDLILTEAGGKLTDLDGAAISYNKEDVYNRAGLLGSNGLNHDELQAGVARFEAEERGE